MYQRLARKFYVGQVVISVLVIMFGVSYTLRCLFAGQIFCAVCFAIGGYVSGYHLLFRASIKELREYNAKINYSKS